jgi:hypothetical protein
LYRTVPGDFNLDGSVDSADYVVWRKNLGQSSATFVQGDATYNGSIGMDDYAIWQANFGFVRQPLAAASAATAAVPEPTSWVMFCMALLSTPLTWRKRTGVLGGNCS